ncbi:MAG: LysM peptidoglycan-binding domain-containing protein [Verrucomicrobia bacterium]|nr:LysM peptidoglycan-binding domain-containing protein [Verrucomicrobiota bacterium]
MATPAPAPAPAPVAENNLTPAVPVPAPVPAPAPVAPAPVPSKTYVVKKGDSLYKIAKAEKVTIEQLAKANNLSKTSKLQIDQKLVIPTVVAKTEPLPEPTNVVSAPIPAAGGDNKYEVKAGDSLWKIAKNNGVTVATLKQANNLTKDTLRVGQRLVIPAKVSAATPVTNTVLTTDPKQPVYLVGEGDTVASIALKHGVKVEDLMRVNKLNGATRLSVGRKLNIPQASLTPPSAGPAVIAPSLIAN